jgi:hypothetical protein
MLAIDWGWELVRQEGLENLYHFQIPMKHFHSPPASRWRGVIRPIVLIEFALTHIIAPEHW